MISHLKATHLKQDHAYHSTFHPGRSFLRGIRSIIPIQALGNRDCQTFSFLFDSFMERIHCRPGANSRKQYCSFHHLRLSIENSFQETQVNSKSDSFLTKSFLWSFICLRKFRFYLIKGAIAKDIGNVYILLILSLSIFKISSFQVPHSIF